MMGQTINWETTNYSLNFDRRTRAITLTFPAGRRTLCLDDANKFEAVSAFLRMTESSTMDDEKKKATTFNFIMNFAALCGGWTVKEDFDQ